MVDFITHTLHDDILICWAKLWMILNQKKNGEQKRGRIQKPWIVIESKQTNVGHDSDTMITRDFENYVIF